MVVVQRIVRYFRDVMDVMLRFFLIMIMLLRRDDSMDDSMVNGSSGLIYIYLQQVIWSVRPCWCRLVE